MTFEQQSQSLASGRMKKSGLGTAGPVQQPSTSTSTAADIAFLEVENLQIASILSENANAIISELTKGNKEASKALSVEEQLATTRIIVLVPVTSAALHNDSNPMYCR